MNRTDAQRVKELVHHMDPDLDVNTTILHARKSATGKLHRAEPEHVDTCPDLNAASKDNVTLGQLDELEFCTSCYRNVDAIVSTLIPEELASATRGLLGIRHSLESISVDELEIDDLEDLGSLARQYADLFEDEGFNCGQEITSAAPQYQEALETETRILFDHLAQIHADSIGSPKARKILREIMTEYGIQPDDSLVTVAMQSMNMQYEQFVNFEFDAPAGVSHRADRQRTSHLILSLQASFARETVYERAIVRIPAWVAAALKLLRPAVITSSVYPDLDPTVLETATKIWSNTPGEVLNDFDQCVSAAQALLVD